MEPPPPAKRHRGHGAEAILIPHIADILVAHPHESLWENRQWHRIAQLLSTIPEVAQHYTSQHLIVQLQDNGKDWTRAVTAAVAQAKHPGGSSTAAVQHHSEHTDAAHEDDSGEDDDGAALPCSSGSDDILQKTIQLMALDLPPGSYRSTPDAWTDASNANAAAQFRDAMRRHCRLPDRVCCVCMQRQTAAGTHPSSPFRFSSLQPRLEVLRHDLPATDKVPRNGGTLWQRPGTDVQYHLQAETWAHAMDDANTPDPLLHMCVDCHRALHRSSEDADARVPPCALACCDLGPIPDGYQQLPLSEAMLLAVLRPHRHLAVLVNPHSFRPADQSYKGLHGHVVAYPNPQLTKLVRSFPSRLRDLPEVIHVVLVGVADNDAAAQEQAKQQVQRGWHPLSVDGHKLAWHMERMVIQLSRLVQQARTNQQPACSVEGLANLEIDYGAIAELTGLTGTLPDTLLRTCTFVPPGAATQQLLHTLRADPAGYAQTRFAAAAADADAASGAPVSDNTGPGMVPAAVRALRAAAPQPQHPGAVQPDAPLTAQEQQQVQQAEARAQQALQAAQDTHATVAALVAAGTDKLDAGILRRMVCAALCGPNSSALRKHVLEHSWAGLLSQLSLPHGTPAHVTHAVLRHIQYCGARDYVPLLSWTPQQLQAAASGGNAPCAPAAAAPTAAPAAATPPSTASPSTTHHHHRRPAIDRQQVTHAILDLLQGPQGSAVQTALEKHHWHELNEYLRSHSPILDPEGALLGHLSSSGRELYAPLLHSGEGQHAISMRAAAAAAAHSGRPHAPPPPAAAASTSAAAAAAAAAAASPVPGQPPAAAPSGAPSPLDVVHCFDEVDLVCDSSPTLNPETERRDAAAGSSRPAGQPDLFGRIAEGQVLVASRGARKAVDYSPLWFALAHPHMYPNMTGLRPMGMYEETWVALWMTRARSPNFPENPFHTADLVDVLQRHQVNRWSNIRLSMDARELQRIGYMTVADLQMALQLVKDGARGAALAQRLQDSSPAVRDLFNAFKFVSGHVIGSPLGFAKLRSQQLGGSWLTFGPPTLSVTICPAPVHAPLVFEIMGKRYEIRPDGTPAREGLHAQPPWHVRLQQLAAHPSACADFFLAFVAAFLEVYAGWPPGSPTQQDPSCLLGYITDCFGKTENSDAGDLHMHLCFTQPGMQVEQVKDALLSEAGRQRLFAFMESVMCQWLPDPAMVARAEGIGAVDSSLPPIEVGARRGGIMAMDCLPDLSTPTSWQQTTGEATCERCNHSHTFTCAKHGGQATHANCRMELPRPLCPFTVACGAGLVRLRRTGTMIVPHMPSLVAAQPCNNAVNFFIEGGRWARRVFLYTATHPGAPDTDPHLLPPDPEEAAADGAEYAIAYSTKAQGVDGSTALIESLDDLQQRQQQRGHAPTTNVTALNAVADLGRWRVAHIANAAHGTATPLTMAALLGSGASAVVQAHEYVVHDLRLFHQLLLPSASSADEGGARVTPRFALPPLQPAATHGAGHARRPRRRHSVAEAAAAAAHDSGMDGSDGGSASEQEDAAGEYTGPRGRLLSEGVEGAAPLRAVSPVDDYIHRGAAYAAYSPVIMSMWFQKVKVRDAQIQDPRTIQPHLRLGPHHPQHHTHRWKRHRRPHIIQHLSEPLLRPGDGADEQVRETYAAWALGNFCAYAALDADGTLSLRPPYWPQLQEALKRSDDATRIMHRFLDNAQSRARTRLRGEARRAALAAEAAADSSDRDVAQQQALQQLVPDALQPTPAADPSSDTQVQDEDADEAALLQQQDSGSDEDGEPPVPLQQALASARDRPLSDANTSAALHEFSATPPRAAADAYPALQHALPLPMPPQQPPQQQQPQQALQQQQQQQPTLLRPSREAVAQLLAQQQQYRHALDSTADDAERQLLNMQPAGGPHQVLHLDRTHGLVPVLTTASPQGVVLHQRRCDAGQLPPYVLLPSDERPSPEDTAQLFLLTEDQREPFLMLAYTFHAEHNHGLQTPPLGMLVTGDAGTGKSRIILALLWHAFQHRGSHLILVTSYMWRAAMHITTPANVALSTTTLFSLGRHRRRHAFTQYTMAAVYERTRAARIIIIDEYAVMGAAHWAHLCLSARRISQILHRTLELPDAAPLGHFHVAVFGDPRQHMAPQAAPLHGTPMPRAPPHLHAANAAAAGESLVARGHAFLAQLHQVFYLQRQHRRSDTPEGQRLHEVAHLFDGLGQGTPQQVEAAADALNARALPNLDALPLLRAVVLRHQVQLYLNRRLMERHARAAGETIYIWRSVDVMEDTRSPVPAELAAHLDSTAYNHTDKLPTFGAFFSGIMYTFADSTAPSLHRITNNGATGVALLLHPDEPPPLDTGAPVRVLRYMPLGVVVRPNGPPLGPVISGNANVPPDCILITPETHTFSVTFRGQTSRILRNGISLVDGYAVTDYSAQGDNFAGSNWAAHLSPPAHGALIRASVYVIVTRYPDLSALHLLAPLWAAGDVQGRTHVVQAFQTVARRDERLAAELERLDQAAQQQRSATPQQLAHLRERAGM